MNGRRLRKIRTSKLRETCAVRNNLDVTPRTTPARDGAQSRTPGAKAAPKLELAARAPPFEFLESRIHVPTPRAGSISRTALVNKLRAARSIPVATVIGPAGYGKTTLLSQWAARDSRPFAWVSIDDRDNDPIVLLRHIAAALGLEEPLPQRLVAALRSPGPSLWSSAIPRLAALLRERGPMVLVLDDFSLLRSRASLEAVAALIDDEAEGSTLVLSGRVPPRIALVPLRAGGRLLELGAEELALTRREAKLLLRATGLRLSDTTTTKLIERSEGWAAALYLAALSIRDAKEAGRSPIRFTGEDRYLADYFRSEYLSHLRPGPLRFLRRTSLLDQMSGQLCDAMLDDEGSAQELEKIERANLFLVALDNRRQWYRYHHLFRGLLRRELVEQEPDLVPVLHRRAADWFEANGDPESALEHAYEAGDTDRAAAILVSIALSVYYSGRIGTLERWLRRFEKAGLLERYPAVALLGCGFQLVRGDREQALRWLEMAERGDLTGPMPDGSPSLLPWIRVLRAWLCDAGAKTMLADAEAALCELPEESNWRPGAHVAQGAALHLLDDDEGADDALSQAAASAASCGADETGAIALSLQALLLAARGDHTAAETLATEAGELLTSSGGNGYPARALERATRARILLRNGHWNDARAALAAAQEVRLFLTDSMPWLAVLARLELARGLTTLQDAEAARDVLDEVEEICGRFPGLGRVPAEAQALRRELEALPERGGATSAGLTRAELRLLPLLATHLSFREIAEELHVSRNTIKTQAISVYRKLGVSSRSEAIAEAHRLGLGHRLRVLIES
jgi:LuxR family maltose regulon positive regulatory protein